MDAVYTVVAALVVQWLVEGVKFVGAWVTGLIPKLPSWVKSLTPLWKLLTAIIVTILVVWGTQKFAIELSHPLFVLVLAQIAHEVTSAIRKARATPDAEG